MERYFVYFGEYIDLFKSKSADLPYRKVGFTTDLEQREYQLNRTKGPIGYSYIAAWECPDKKSMHDLEWVIHNFKSGSRCDNTEWFEDPDNIILEEADAYCARMGYPRVSLEGSEVEQKIVRDRESANQMTKRLAGMVPIQEGSTFTKTNSGRIVLAGYAAYKTPIEMKPQNQILSIYFRSSEYEIEQVADMLGVSEDVIVPSGENFKYAAPSYRRETDERKVEIVQEYMEKIASSEHFNS